jgi:bacterioferritin-associated ferredoxin
MIICSCNVLSDREVRIAVAANEPLRTIGRLFRYLGCTAQCGRCARSIKRIRDERDHPLDAHGGGLLPTRLIGPSARHSPGSPRHRRSL